MIALLSSLLRPAPVPADVARDRAFANYYRKRGLNPTTNMRPPPEGMRMAVYQTRKNLSDPSR